jgi:hypothetical protein
MPGSAHILALMIAHDRDGVRCILEKFHDLGSFWPTVDDIADTDHRVSSS